MREYRLVRTFDFERNGMGGKDIVPLGIDLPQERLLHQLVLHKRFAEKVEVEEREVSRWERVELV